MITGIDFLANFTSPGDTFLQIGGLKIRWYGFLIASALVIGTSLASRLASRRRVSSDTIGDLVIWLVIGAIPCARLYYVLFQWPDYAANPSKIFAIWEGGIAIHGAIIGGTIAAIIFAKRNGLSFWNLADIVAPPLILGQAIGRWGNFFNSEAFGAPTNLPWKLFIPVDRRPFDLRQFEYFHPTFLYESLWNLGVFAILMILFFRMKNPAKGTIFLAYCILYSCGRFWIEGLRTDSLIFGPIKMAQAISLIGVAIGSIGLFILYGRRQNLPDTQR
jgi:phosphatidylglycerol---prolipoprotein diacylglyceryl transferase